MIPLVVRSHYSLMWGTDAIPRLCRTAAAMGYRRLALTDTDNLYGLWSFLAACRRHAITPIVGAELTDSTGGSRAVCLVETAAGYRNLCRLITQRRLQTGFRLQTALPPLAAGLLVLTPDPGLLVDWHGAGVSLAAAMPRRPLAASHPLRHQARVLGVPLVATPDSFWTDPRDVAVHRLLRAIDRNTSLSRLAASDVASTDAWLAPPAEYARRFAGCPEALRVTHMLAERLAFTGPRFGVILPPLEGGDADRRLRAAAYAGARRRYGQELSETVVERLEHELRTHCRHGVLRLLPDRA